MKTFVYDLFGGAGRPWKLSVSSVCAIAIGLALLAITVCALLAWQHRLARENHGAVAEMPVIDARDPADQPGGDNADSEQAKKRCPECGVIQSIRMSEANGDKPAIYETTIRFDNGSTRVLTDSNLAHWRIGEHITFIGGPASPRR